MLLSLQRIFTADPLLSWQNKRIMSPALTRWQGSSWQLLPLLSHLCEPSAGSRGIVSLHRLFPQHNRERLSVASFIVVEKSLPLPGKWLLGLGTTDVKSMLWNNIHAITSAGREPFLSTSLSRGHNVADREESCWIRIHFRKDVWVLSWKPKKPLLFKNTVFC